LFGFAHDLGLFLCARESILAAAAGEKEAPAAHGKMLLNRDDFGRGGVSR